MIEPDFVEIAVIPSELEEHWRGVLEDASVGARFEATSEGVRVLVHPRDAVSTKTLFESPFEGEEALPEDVEAPMLGPTDRTETLVVTQNPLIAEQLCRELHRAGLFAGTHSSLASSVFGTEGAQQFTVVIAQGQRDAACEVLTRWAQTRANDFYATAGLTTTELFDVLRSFLSALPR